MSKKLKLIYVIFLLLSISICVLFCFCNKKPIIKLKGKKNITIELNTKYEELGYYAKYLNKDISDKIKIDSNLDVTKTGKYKIRYYLEYKDEVYEKIRYINVVDSSNAVINLLGEGVIELCPNAEYKELGYSAFDKNNNEITDKVISEIRDSEVNYYINDNGNFAANKRQIVRKDEDNPEISLEGYQSLTLYVGSTYYEPGYSAIDNCDGDLTDKIKIDGYVDTNKVGKYKLVYSVEDSSSNVTSTDRIINIIEEPDANQKTIYFTFDDGPSSTTTRILDILKEENIKATFFVINASEKYDEVIKRAYDEGHTIGLHSYSHNYKSIYKSMDAYFDDLYLINDKVEKITGYKSNIIRFPGGSSNTISRISNGLMTKLSVKTKDEGFIYFDWNIASYDTSKISADRIYKKVVSQLENTDYNTNVILMHDFQNNNRTVKALSKIIKYCKDNGYRFDKITEITPQIKHKIRN